ncbi:hypothetical protein K435DRAFT_771416 [Dendrothele bispora CBS 962.96]|uniref:BTB domain-containing protein n=1 Tax=Dendrothele bispora (strain CBS 962.96) TaxID=1314807 RepID=A0A4V4HAL1_DENBC|nr:hypothetical protein K435DRAFT_771416 [Dendrothele bispora CBS 962.96]
MSQAPTIQLPRSLARPDYTEVSKAALQSIAPELADVPLGYIRWSLRLQQAQMTEGLNALVPSHTPNYLPKTHLPSHLTIPLHHSYPSSVAPAYPTHALAVSSGFDPTNSEPYALIIPIHSLVLIAHCARLPTLPFDGSVCHESPSRVRIPVITIVLPSPRGFPILLKFLYTHSLESVLRSLVSLPSAQQSLGLSHETVLQIMNSPSTLRQLAQDHCERSNYNMQMLTTQAAHVKDFWPDVVALGVNDMALWDTLDLAWEVVLGAMNICAWTVDGSMMIP